MCRIPFDWKNPFGYFIVMVSTYKICEYLLLIGMSMFACALGGIFFGHAVIKDLKNYLIEINETARLKEDHPHATEQLYDFVHTHTLAKQLSQWFICQIESSMKFFQLSFFRLLFSILDLVEYLAMVFFAWTSVIVCVSFLIIQVEIVECFLNQPNILLINCFDFFYLVKTQNRICTSSDNHCFRKLYFLRRASCMRAWTTSHRHVFFDDRCNRTIGLVFASIGNAANVSWNFTKRSKTSRYKMFWKHCR